MCGAVALVGLYCIAVAEINNYELAAEKDALLGFSECEIRDGGDWVENDFGCHL